MDNGKWVRFQRNVEVLRVYPETTDEEIAAFDRDFRLAGWMRNQGVSLVRIDGGTTRCVDNETFYREYGLIPNPAGVPVSEMPALLAKSLVALEELDQDIDGRYIAVIFQVNN